MIDLLTGIVIDDAMDSAVDILAGADVGMWVFAIAALDLMPTLSSSAKAFGSGACSCCPTTAKGCRALQAWMPSCHVCSRFSSLALPQLPNQDPPRAQQLSLPDF